MKRVLITGISGVGKSTVIKALSARGYKAIDADEGGLSELVRVPLEEPTGLDPGQDWVWNKERVQKLLSTEDADFLFLGGCSANQGEFYPQFDQIILLSAPASVMAERLATRTNNPYGKRPEELRRALSLKETIEPLLRRGADHEIDTTAPIDEVVADILDFAREAS